MRAVVFGYWKEPVSVEIATKRFSAISQMSGKSCTGEKFVENLSGRRRGGIDVSKIAVAGFVGW